MSGDKKKGVKQDSSKDTKRESKKEVKKETKQDVVDEAYDRAVEVLHMNVTPLGFSASTNKHSNYFSVWARDHAIITIAACLTEDQKLIETAKAGVLQLLKKQVDHGQVPSYIEIEKRKSVYGGLGAITSIDSNMWVVIASALLFKKTGDRKFILPSNLDRYQRFYRLFKAFDSNDCGLMEVPRAGDWADIFDRTYHVLYDECLYYQALKDLSYLFKEASYRIKDGSVVKDMVKRVRWISKRQPRVKRKINDTFWFTKENMSRIFEEYMIYENIKHEDYNYYQSHLMPFKIEWHRRFDSFGNLLAILTKTANKERSKKIIRYVLKNGINKPFPIKAMAPPVYKHEKDWESIYRLKEQPHTYHNGGIWPMIGGFWIHALSKSGYPKTASKDLKSLAENLKKQKWLFNEYMHGKTGKPMGRTYQAWSAAGYVIAYHSVKSNFSIFAN